MLSVSMAGSNGLQTMCCIADKHGTNHKSIYHSIMSNTVDWEIFAFFFLRDKFPRV